MKKKRRKANVVPPLGPATNLRPAGAHASKKLYDRKKMKAIFRKEEDGFHANVRCANTTGRYRFLVAEH